jgi:hypothetical protein
MLNKTTLGIIALIASIFVFGGGKATEFVNSVKSSINLIQYRIKNIKNLDWIGGLTDPRLRFKFDLDLINPSQTSFNFSAGSTLTITKIIFNDRNGNPLITSTPNITSISIPKNGIQLIENITAEIPVKKLAVAYDLFQNMTPETLNIDVYISIAGQEFKIKREYLN